jgi:hypothetical protein
MDMGDLAKKSLAQWYIKAKGFGLLKLRLDTNVFFAALVIWPIKRSKSVALLHFKFVFGLHNFFYYVVS